MRRGRSPRPTVIMLSNLHTHSTFCDGAATPEAMVEAALEKGFGELGFSSHSDMVKDIPAYIAEIRRLQAKYADRIRILCGLEAELAKPFKRPEGLDYVIGSFHFITAPDGTFFAIDASPEELEAGVRDHFAGDAQAFVKAYFAFEREIVKRDDFDFLAHPDLVRKFNARHPYFDEASAWYREELVKTADAIAASGKPVEINTGAISRGWMDDAYPSSAFRELLKARGVRFVLTSDAHAPEGLACAFDRFAITRS